MPLKAALRKDWKGGGGTCSLLSPGGIVPQVLIV